MGRLHWVPSVRRGPTGVVGNMHGHDVGLRVHVCHGRLAAAGFGKFRRRGEVVLILVMWKRKSCKLPYTGGYVGSVDAGAVRVSTQLARRGPGDRVSTITLLLWLLLLRLLLVEGLL